MYCLIHFPKFLSYLCVQEFSVVSFFFYNYKFSCSSYFLKTSTLRICYDDSPVDSYFCLFKPSSTTSFVFRAIIAYLIFHKKIQRSVLSFLFLSLNTLLICRINHSLFFFLSYLCISLSVDCKIRFKYGYQLDFDVFNMLFRTWAVSFAGDREFCLLIFNSSSYLLSFTSLSNSSLTYISESAVNTVSSALLILLLYS